MSEPERDENHDVDTRATSRSIHGIWLVVGVAALFAAAALTILYWPKQPRGDLGPDEPPPSARGTPSGG